MVAQNSPRIQRPSHRPWFVLPPLILALATALASFAVEAKSLASQVDDGTSWYRPDPDFVTKASLIDQAQEQTDLFWCSASPRAEIEPPSALEQDSELALSWIRKHLGTKSPYPHETRQTGPLTDTPEGYELAQLHLVSRIHVVACTTCPHIP
jgi:hypothetical protein